MPRKGPRNRRAKIQTGFFVLFCFVYKFVSGQNKTKIHNKIVFFPTMRRDLPFQLCFPVPFKKKKIIINLSLQRAELEFRWHKKKADNDTINLGGAVGRTSGMNKWRILLWIKLGHLVFYFPPEAQRISKWETQ